MVSLDSRFLGAERGAETSIIALALLQVSRAQGRQMLETKNRINTVSNLHAKGGRPMLPTRFCVAPLALADFLGSGLNADNGTGSPKGRVYLIAVGAASVVLLGLLLFSLGTFNPPAASSSVTTTTTTSYVVDASSVIASAATNAPGGYAQGSSGQLNPSESGLVSGGYGTFLKQGGSVANMTVLVFDTPQSAQTYIASVINNAKGLLGYTDMSKALASYQHYGVCYGYGEPDPDGNGAVATGMCNKGNVYIQVHVVSPSSLSSAQGDMSDLVGAAYEGTR
jgi:hypothetical protein